MKTFFNFLHKNNLVKPNPMKNIRQLRDRQRIIETLEDDEIVLFANHMKEQNTNEGRGGYCDGTKTPKTR
jgi:site-specific recombinase XerD